MTVYNGAATRGLAIVGSEDIFLKNISIDNIISEHGNSCGLDLINECKNIRARDNIICLPDIDKPEKLPQRH